MYKKRFLKWFYKRNTGTSRGAIREITVTTARFRGFDIEESVIDDYLTHSTLTKESSSREIIDEIELFLTDYENNN